MLLFAANKAKVPSPVPLSPQQTSACKAWPTRFLEKKMHGDISLSCTKGFALLNVSQLFITVIFSQGLPGPLAEPAVPAQSSPASAERAAEGWGC